MMGRGGTLQHVALGSVLTIVYRLACASTLVTLAVLSLLPAESLHRTDLGGHAEHLLAYAGTAFVFGIGVRRRTWLTLIVLTAYAGMLEFLQVIVPGRTPQIADFLLSSAGVVLGLVIAAPLQARLDK